MKYLVFVSVLLAAFVASASPQDTMCEDRYPNLCRGTITYSCSGVRLSGTISVTPLDQVTEKPGGNGIAYQIVSRLSVGGRPVVVTGEHEVKYKRRYLDRFGTWEPNHDVWLYNLMAVGQRHISQRIPLYLEVSHGGKRGIRGYMAFWVDESPRDPSFNFTCRRL